jgi:hypothetical protein
MGGEEGCWSGRQGRPGRAHYTGALSLAIARTRGRRRAHEGDWVKSRGRRRWERRRGARAGVGGDGKEEEDQEQGWEEMEKKRRSKSRGQKGGHPNLTDARRSR